MEWLVRGYLVTLGAAGALGVLFYVTVARRYAIAVARGLATIGWVALLVAYQRVVAGSPAAAWAVMVLPATLLLEVLCTAADFHELDRLPASGEAERRSRNRVGIVGGALLLAPAVAMGLVVVMRALARR